MPPTFAPPESPSIPLHIVSKEALGDWLPGLDESARTWVSATGFTAGIGSVALIPGENGTIRMAAAGIGDAEERKRGRFPLAAARKALPEGTYRLAETPRGIDPAQEALGWLFAQYRFERYKHCAGGTAAMQAPDGVDAGRIEAIAAGEFLTRDLINTPAADMGPSALEQAAREVGAEFGADLTVARGDALLDRNFPMIHAVGRAAADPPRLLDMRWGSAGPRLTLAGKGVCFDTGGLNLKPGQAMNLMKKDMGGAAAVLGLARMIMALKLPVQLRVLIPAVENSVSAGAMRPGDVLTSRKGLTVEINNTDAEGRLVLADAIALAGEEEPDLLISMATLTGAARVAVGPDIAPFYATDPNLADAIRAGASAAADPVWELPFHDPYEKMIEPAIADLDNAPSGGFAGSITAALFLRRFIGKARSYAHFDIYGWQPSAAPGRPKGGAGQGARALLEALPPVLGI